MKGKYELVLEYSVCGSHYHQVCKYVDEVMDSFEREWDAFVHCNLALGYHS